MLHFKGIGGRTTPLDPERQEPTQADASRTTEATQRHSLQQESFNKRALRRGDHLIFWRKDQDAATPFAPMVLCPRLNMPVALVPPRSPLGICVSWNQTALFSLPSPQCLRLAQSSMNLPKALLE